MIDSPTNSNSTVVGLLLTRVTYLIPWADLPVCKTN